MMAAQHDRRRQQTLLFCFCVAIKSGEIASTAVAHPSICSDVTDRLVKKIVSNKRLLSKKDSAVARELVGVRSVFQKDRDLHKMADSDSCASTTARQSLQLHLSNHETRHRRHTGIDTDSDAEDSVEDSITMDGPPLASLSLTHVHYDPTSKISHACAFLALVPQALCITYATLIWSSREMEVLLMFAGQMGCEALNWVLKRFIREDRPAQMLGKGYGMPSSHAQFVAFFAVYLGLWVVVRHDPWKNTESKTHVPTPMWQRVGLAVLAMGGAVAVAQSRMYVSQPCSSSIERVSDFNVDISTTTHHARCMQALQSAHYAALRGSSPLQSEDTLVWSTTCST